jgi:PTS system nitrogen regulatory IIA component
VRKPEQLYERLRERESLGSTALGRGVAVPHCRLQGLSKVLLAVGVSDRGVEFAAEDGEPVRVFFLMVSPNSAAAEHLHGLAAISRWIQSGRIARLLELETADAIYRLIGETAPADV